MGKDIPMLQECGTLNRVFAAYFLNKTGELGVDYQDLKPQMDNIISYNNGSYFFNENDYPNGLKSFFQGCITIEDIDLNKFRSVGIYEFFYEDIKEKLDGVAKHFAEEIEKNKYCDLVFSSLPDAPPFAFDCIMDPETNFKARLIIGYNIAGDTYNARWEFYCLLMSKFREGEPHPIYGKHFRNFDSMTDEEREKINNKPESK